MPKIDSRNGQTLRLEREFAHSCGELWRAWTNPELLLLWFGPKHAPASEMVADVRTGGRWRARLDDHNSGHALYVSGHFVKIVPQRRLVFSFRWEGDAHEDGPGVDTLVTVEFEALAADHTRIVLSQVGLASEESATGHTEGWRSCLDRLGEYLNVSAGAQRFV